MQLPLFVNSSSFQCLLVGGGSVAERKFRTLLRHGVETVVVALEVKESFLGLLVESRTSFELRAFEKDDLNGIDLVICATSDETFNASVANLCRERRILVNVVDNFELSTVTFPSIVNRNPVLVAVSTEGHSPTLASRLRSQIETLLSPNLGRLAEFLSEKRKSFSDIDSKRRISNQIIDSPILAQIDQGNLAEADRLFNELSNVSAATNSGFVSLVGAGPGDPDLLTLKASRALQLADVVFYDNLVSKEVLDRVRRDAEMVYVGKKRDFQGTRQEEIHRMLLEAAQKGNRVVRLKGGDPFLFGRGGEELDVLLKHGITCEVIPGITAASGCAAYAGIPLTHRDYSQSVRFVTGHLRSNEINLDWPELAKEDQTLVVYMGLANMSFFTENLLKNGMSRTTPIAVISRGTYPDQQVVRSNLEQINMELENHELQSPTTAIIGQVVDAVSN